MQTVGPNTGAPEKAVMLGEAAHIRGAKPNSARYDPSMSDVTRAEITNGIWLCCNCHTLVDRDEVRFDADLLFAWRKEHEDRVLLELGTPGERIRHEVDMGKLSFLAGCPAVVKGVAIDQPPGWKWRFVAELMRHLNKPEFDRLASLRAGETFKPYPSVDEADFIDWLQDRGHVMANLIPPLTILMDRLNRSWQDEARTGSAEEMFDVCVLIRNMLANIVDHEEILSFTRIPEEGEELRALLRDAIGHNTDQLREIPLGLDRAVALIDQDHGGTEDDPVVLRTSLVFDVPQTFIDGYRPLLDKYLDFMRSQY